jgi:hypothetical protein
MSFAQMSLWANITKPMSLTWVRFVRARWNHAVVGNLVVEGEGEGRGVVFVDGHGGVVGEVGLVHHLEHVVASDLGKNGGKFKFWREIQFWRENQILNDENVDTDVDNEWAVEVSLLNKCSS